LPENLYRVFNETDLDKRKGAISDLWDEDGIFIDPDGVHQGPEKISAVVTALQRQFPGSVFFDPQPVLISKEFLVELVGIEPTTSSLRTMRSPS
jgi:hypothetical protein